MSYADLDPSGPWITIACPRSENQLAESVPGARFRKDTGTWRCPASWTAWVILRVAWEGVPLDCSPALLAAAAWWQGMTAQRDRDRLALDTTGYAQDMEALDLIAKIEAREGMTRQLDPVQRGSAAWLLKWGRKIPGLSGAMYVDPMGNGKTGAVIRALQMLAETGEEPCPALWICRGSALLGLADKIAAWAPELTVSVVTGSKDKRAKALAEPADVYVIAWPNLRYHTRLARWPSKELVKCGEHGGSNPKIGVSGCEVHEKELNAMSIRTVIADEAHAMAGDTPKIAKQTQAAWHLAHHADRFWPVTGTPVTSNIKGLWGILHGLDPDAWPARTRYVDFFAVKDYTYWGETILGVRPDREAAFRAVTDPLLRRIPREVARPLQPARLDPEFRYPEMTGAQKKAYAQLKAEILADLEDRTIVPANDGVLFSRLRQLASSYLESHDTEDADGFTRPGVIPALPSNKADDLAEFVQDTDDQVVVALNSPHLAALCGRKLDAAKVTHTAITGAMTPQQRYDANRAFLDGQARVIFITAAGGESIDLQVSHTIVFLEPDPSYSSREQKIGRVDRWGQEHGVRVVNCLSPGSVDERLYQLGNEKEERAAQVTQDAELIRWLIGNEDSV